jgi:glycerate 2-kinase
MSLKVLIAPDKFKGTLTAPEAADAIARGWHRARPADNLELLPMSDGGDGFGAAISELLRARLQQIETVDAAHRRCNTFWWWEPKSKTAIIESANVIGLAQLPAKKFHPFALDTFGLGAVIRAAAAKGAKRCLIGIGGSATNDGGFGVARALGWEFLDRDGGEIADWPKLTNLAKVVAPKQTRWFDELIVAVDVQNLLLGARGCSRIYGPQKGLRSEDFPRAEKSLRRFQNLSVLAHGHGEKSVKGDGAAGGLGFGLRIFANARLEPGFDLFAQMSGLSKRLKMADLVITGEGAIDPQTLMGKGVGQLAERCAKLKIPCIGLAGTILTGRKQKFFAELHGLTDLTSAENAKKRAGFWLERLADTVAEKFQS